VRKQTGMVQLCDRDRQAAGLETRDPRTAFTWRPPFNTSKNVRQAISVWLTARRMLPVRTCQFASGSTFWYAHEPIGGLRDVPLSRGRTGNIGGMFRILTQCATP
jgi:hypothetical protein